MKNILPIILLALLCTACSESKKEPNKLERISWINGFWKMNTTEGTMTESWNPANDSTYLGVGKFTDSDGRVLSNEEIRIVLRKDQLWYIPTVDNQNMGKPISFKEISFSDTMVVFENKGHDFPQRIGYIKKSDNNIQAYIEGEVEGQMQRMDFDYEKQ